MDASLSHVSLSLPPPFPSNKNNNKMHDEQNANLLSHGGIRWGQRQVTEIQGLPSPGAVREKEQLLEGSSLFQSDSGTHRPHKSCETPRIGTGYVILETLGTMKMYGRLLKNDEEF